MDQVSTLERLFRYKAHSNEEILAAMRLFDDAAPAKDIAIRVLSHTYVVDRIFAATLTGSEHGYTSANISQAPSLEELSAAIKASDQWYIDYVSRLDNAQLAERIDFTFTDGEPGRMSREEMLMHVTIHGGSHRGQVGWIMMENSITPPADDRLTSYLHKAEAQPAAAWRVKPAPQGAGVGPNRSESGEVLSPLDELTQRMKSAVGADPSLGKTMKFDLKGEGVIYLDGDTVTNEDRPADLTLTVTIDDLNAISQGELAPMTAMVAGRLGLSDMDVAMGLQGQLQGLFSRMRTAT